MDALRWWPTLGLMILSSGCRLISPNEFWCPPPIGVHAPAQAECGDGPCAPDEWSDDLAFALWCDRQCSPQSTSAYLKVIERHSPHQLSEPISGLRDTKRILDHCLARFLACAERHRQYVPGVGIVIKEGDQSRVVPVRIVGSAWKAEDVQSLHPVGQYRSKSLMRAIQRRGWGVPIVATRNHPTDLHPGDQFVTPGTPFALTAVARTSDSAATARTSDTPPTVIELHDPLSSREVEIGGVAHPLAADLSAPLVFLHLTGEQKVEPFNWFIHPEMADEADGLFFLEPYQPGKIPVILIHGLLSSPSTWVDMANELRNLPGFSERFQIWGFRYATGRPFVASAALLRKELALALHQLREAGPDPALDQIVLIGHSMGGLIAKSQISESGDTMWRSIANRPLSAIVADEETKSTLAEQFYFSPQPAVRRAVFIAVPHGGSTLATRMVGQLGSFLVDPAATAKQQHRELLACNPGTFTNEVGRRFPTSIDLLETRSEILQALYRLPTGPGVRMHSIIGDGRYAVGDGIGDGVVGVENARHPNVDSELYVPTTHTAIHRRPETICEVWRILREHHQQFIQTDTAPGLPVTPEPAAAESFLPR